jgi:ketosteroid isomerase-like protein
MRKLLFCAALLGCTMLLQAQSATNEADMHTFAREFMAAYNQGDHQALRKMYTEYAIRVDQEGKELTGGNKIAAYFAEQFRLNNATLLLRQESFTQSDASRAWVAKGSYEIYGKTNIYDIEIGLAGHYTNTMVKDRGKWKIAKSVHAPLPPSENVAVVDGLYQSFAKGDVPAVLAVMDADIVWNEAESFPYADKNPYIGPDAVLNGVFARIGAEWEYWNLADIQLHDMANDMVLATLRYKAKHKATGKEIDSQTAHLWTLKYGKIMAFQQFTDTKQAGEAVK